MEKMTRTDARKVSMRILYKMFLYDYNKMFYDIDEMIEESTLVQDDFIVQVVKGVIENKEQLYSLANDNLNKWNINRLGFIDQAILCMGIYELLYIDTPSNITINEAIELAKEFSDDKVKNMINAVLDAIYHKKGLDGK